MIRMAEADFETTVLESDCRVWAWAISYVGEGNEPVYGNSIDSFLVYIAEHGPCLYWFHNLGFDGKFITDRLLNLGYQWTADRPQAGQFTTLVSGKGKFYSMRICFWSGMSIEIRDSLKVFPMAVRSVAQAFNLPEGKGDLDYEEFREVGHVLTDEEKDYIRRDVEIVAQALKVFSDQGLTKMTIGSNAFDFFKKQFGKDAYEHYFPQITLQEDAEIRESYRGGFTYVSPDYANVDVYGGISVDYNSMYPSMLISKRYPVGTPRLFYGRYAEPVDRLKRAAGDAGDGEDSAMAGWESAGLCQVDGLDGLPGWDYDVELYVQRLTCAFKLKPDGIPMVQLRNSGFYGDHEYVRETVEPVTISLTCIDLQLLFENYDVDVYEWLGGYAFRTESGERLFGAYVDYWGGIKRKSKGAMRTLAKLMLNNIYGKFATNPDVTGKRPVLGDDGIVHWVLNDPETRDPVYIPIGTFCTAYARKTLIHAIHENRDRFIYCDTDSMHLTGLEDPAGIKLHDTDLCAWKVEGQFTHARHIRAKCYIWDLNGEISVTCAGMPDNIKKICTFDNFQIGLNNLKPDGTIIEGTGKLTPVAVPGGVVLKARPYQLRPV